MKKMDRKAFIKTLGLNAAMAILYPCLTSCTDMANPYVFKSEDALLGKIVKIDLQDEQYIKLKEPGGYVVINNELVVAKTKDNNYVAATRTCSDEHYKKIIWDKKNEEWVCLEHSATFDVNGNGTTRYNNLGRNGLAIYQTSVIGNTLTIILS